MTEERKLSVSADVFGRLAAMAFCRADTVLQLNDDLAITYCVGSTAGTFGKTSDALVGTHFLDLFEPSDSAKLRDLFANKEAGARIEDTLVHVESSSGGVAEIAISGYRVPDFDNDFFVGLKIAPKTLIKYVDRHVERDGDTGMMDKDSFVDTAAERIAEFEASGGKAKVSMVNIGEFAGDEDERSKVMEALGEVMRSESLGGDTAGRIDDENFSLVHGDAMDAVALSEKISNAMASVPGAANSLMPKIATMEEDSSSINSQQMAKALMVSLQAFADGETDMDGANMNAVVEKKMQENMKSIERFRSICDEGLFDLVYMPVCELGVGKIHHFEALTRFRHDTGASPFALITLAEDVGIITDFDMAVAKRAIEGLEWYREAKADVSVAINVSGHSISDEKFCDELADMLMRQYGMEKFLSVEITESAEIQDLEGVNFSIQKFRRMGYTVALDDFGADAASFDYLNSFDVDTVKFDGPVVKRASGTKKGKAFLKSMATLCNEIGVETIAEMVEDANLAAFLGQCGIHLGQGWYFGKPDSEMTSFPPILPPEAMAKAANVTTKKPAGANEEFAPLA